MALSLKISRCGFVFSFQSRTVLGLRLRKELGVGAGGLCYGVGAGVCDSVGLTGLRTGLC